MRTEVHWIDLKKARQFLEHNVLFERGKDDTNRPVSYKKVNQWAFEMLSGRWRLTHQGIGFDVNGALKDGQHRLLAVEQACTVGAREGDVELPPDPRLKIQMQVTFGLEPDVFDVLDSGLQRSSTHVLQIAGYTNGMALSAAARLIYMYENHEYRSWTSIKVDNHKVLQIVRDYHLDEYLPTGASLKHIGMIVAAATAGYYICEQANPDGRHLEFINGLKEGVGLIKEDPRLVLRNYLIRSKNVATRVRRDAAMHLALYIKTWNDFSASRRRSVISWRSTEPFPRPEVEKPNHD